MLNLAKKPALVIGATAILVFGAAGISAAAPNTRLTGTTPAAEPAPGRGPKQDSAALAAALGVSVTKLREAVEAAREASDFGDPATEAADQMAALADALRTTDATVEAVLSEQRTAKAAAGAPSSTTPKATATTTATATPVRQGGQRRADRGRPTLAEQSALITALAKATGQSEAAVKAALTQSDEARAQARQEREAEFANNLAVQLGLTESKVAAALEASRPAKPTRAANQGTSQAK